jgi:cell wall assembly regulator SMI1
MGLVGQRGGRERIAERRHNALLLRVSGASTRDIAKAIGEAKSTIDRDLRAVVRELNEQTFEQIAEHRRLELERLDAVQSSLWPALMKGDTTAALRIIQVINLRSKLLSLFEPEYFSPRAEVLKWAAELDMDPEEAVLAVRDFLEAGG